jgi:hypothetical protein
MNKLYIPIGIGIVVSTLIWIGNYSTLHVITSGIIAMLISEQVRLNYKLANLTEILIKKTDEIETVMKHPIFEKDAYSNIKDDIQCLYGNQKSLVSLINAIRIRVNNFYAKKIKDKSLRFKKEDITSEPGDSFEKE